MQIANPILARELKERMRTVRAPVVLTIYLLVLGLVAFAAERIISQDAAFNPAASAGLGRAVFHFILFFTLLLVCFLVPGFTASSISAERERQTFPLLQVTLLRPSSIVLGKLASSLAYLLLLILATLPLISVSFILGGVAPLDVLRGYGMVLVTGFTIAMVGIGLSATLRKTVSATVLSYALVGLLVLGTVISYGLTRVIVERSGRDPGGHIWGLVVNPFVGTASAIRGAGAVGGASTPFSSLFEFIAPRVFFAEGIAVDQGVAVVVGPGGTVEKRVFRGGDLPVEIGAQQVQPRKSLPIWVSTLGWYAAMSGVGYVLAVNGVRAPTAGRRPRFRRRARGET